MDCIIHKGKTAHGTLYSNDWVNLSTRIYIEHHGEIPEGYTVYRNCKNSGCIEPTHLYIDVRGPHYYHEVDWQREGEGNQMAVLSEEDVLDIREWNNKGRSNTSLAFEYEVSRQQIWRIVTRKNWSHI